MERENQERKSEDMKRENKKEINFTDYAPLDHDYSKRELADIYKKIITDITQDNK